MRKMAVVTRSEDNRSRVAMQISSQKARMIASCGEILCAMNRIIGSIARAKSVMDRGQPCFTPEVKRSVRQSVLLMKMVWRLSL